MFGSGERKLIAHD